jgi:GNAT superfamily N-acetyltransferase
MISHSEGIQLIESEFPQLTGLYKRSALSSDIYKSIQRLFDFSREAVLDYNLNLSRKCFTLATTLLSQGDIFIKKAIEKSFIYSFSPFAKKREYEKRRLRFFIPDDFYHLFLTKIEKPVMQNHFVSESSIDITDITHRLATKEDWIFARQITDEMHSSAINRGCGISKRSHISVIRKMIEGKAIIAVTLDHRWAGFSYIETFENNGFVSNSGLIVAPAYRGCGVGKAIKQQIFDLSRELYPNSKIFSITTGAAVMKMNTKLGFEPVIYSEITREKKFWLGCKSCVNYQTLLGKDCKNCFCTAMLYTPDQEEPQEQENECETDHRS